MASAMRKKAGPSSCADFDIADRLGERLLHAGQPLIRFALADRKRTVKAHDAGSVGAHEPVTRSADPSIRNSARLSVMGSRSALCIARMPDAAGCCRHDLVEPPGKAAKAFLPTNALES